MKILEVMIVKTKGGKVVARADIHFEGFLLKGFKIIYDNEKKQEYVTPPSYFSGKYWRPLFKTDSKEDWNEIQQRVLDTFNTQQITEVMEETNN